MNGASERIGRHHSKECEHGISKNSDSSENTGKGYDRARQAYKAGINENLQEPRSCSDP